MFKFITNKPFWINAVVGFLLMILLVLGFFASLSWITGHGEYEKVPQVVGQNIEAAKQTLEAQGFNVIVTDSVYNTAYAALSITKQIPEADALVKHGRLIFLTVNRAVPPQVDMPSLIGFSFKSAEMYLKGIGLKLGDTVYRPDFARNAVLEQLFNNQPIKPGTKIPLGSTISFILGSGVGSGEMDVPDLIGLTYEEAKKRIADLSLSLGAVIAVDPMNDFSGSYVVKQTPELITITPTGEQIINKTRPGSTIDIYLSTVAPVKDTTTVTPLQ
ncbi:MAG: PASTA domain-containing protein [Chitinophagaceae bacterium]